MVVDLFGFHFIGKHLTIALHFSAIYFCNQNPIITSVVLSLKADYVSELKEKRRHTEQRERENSFLRIGSLNVKVKSTRELSKYFLGKSTSSSSIQKTWGSVDNLPEIEVNRQFTFHQPHIFNTQN